MAAMFGSTSRNTNTHGRYRLGGARARLGGSCPAERCDGEAGVPDLCQMSNLVAVELHNVHVVRCHFLARRWNRAALTGMSAVEDSIGRNVVALRVGGKGHELVPPVRNAAQQALHPIAILLQTLHVA